MRWHHELDPSIVQVTGHTGRWTEDEDSELKDTLQTHGAKDWAATAALVPGRGEVSAGTDGVMSWIPASTRRIDVRDSLTKHIDKKGDSKVRNAVQPHGGKT
jgi:hypothetical protein